MMRMMRMMRMMQTMIYHRSKPLVQLIIFILLVQPHKSQDASPEPSSSTTVPPVETIPTSTAAPVTSTTTAPPPNDTDSSADVDLTLPSFATRFCACDLTGNLCDLNCCCDADCRAGDKLLFARCLDVPSRYRLLDSKYCYNQKIIFRNNTNYILERMSNFGGLFCIYTDNTKQQAYLVDKKIVRKPSDHKELQLRPEFNWTLSSSLTFDLSVSELIDKGRLESSYRAEKAVYILSLKRSEPPAKQYIGLSRLRFPYSLVIPNGECNSLRNVGYLTAFSSYCFKWIRNLSASCKTNTRFDVNSYNLYLVSNGAQLREDNLFIENVNSFCADYKCVQTKSEKPVKAIAYQEQVCRNMVKSVDYQIGYDEQNGITRVLVAFEYEDLKDEQMPIKRFQRYTVRFVHESLLNGTANISHYSGNLGYQLERPLISRNLRDGREEAESFEFAQLQRDNDACDPKQVEKRAALFGLNHRSGCFFDLSRHLDLSKRASRVCDDLNDLILQVFDQRDEQPLDAMPSGNSTQLSAYGKYNLTAADQWVPLLQQKQDETGKPSTTTAGYKTCTLLKQVNYLFVYAMVADLREPQRKLVSAVQTRVYHSFEICLNSVLCRNQAIELSTSVQFLQMKSEKRMRFADSPAFKLKLPEDFFYPISS